MGVFGLQNAATGENHAIADELLVGREHGFMDARMSRNHFKIYVDRGSVYVEDLGSSNGTYLNTNRLSPGEPAGVQPGDAIEAGDTSFIVLADVGDDLGRGKKRGTKRKKSDYAHDDQDSAKPGLLRRLLIIVVFAAGVGGGYIAFQEFGGPELVASVMGRISQQAGAPAADTQKTETAGAEITPADSSQAQKVLSAIYEAEVAHQTAHGFFTTDLTVATEGSGGFGTGPFGYKFGFTTSSQHDPEQIAKYGKPLDPSRKDSDALALSYLKSIPPLAFTEAASIACPDCTATTASFKAIAIGNTDADESLDIWTVDEKKNLLHLVDDSKE